MSHERETFLSRWSRRKHDAGRDAQVATAQPDAAGAVPVVPDAAAVPGDPRDNDKSQQVPPALPPIDTLTPQSDFRDFLHPQVDEGVKRAALKKLFSDPHFNVMDGLDVYIDDYSKPDPLPLDMLAQMKAAQRIFRWAQNKGDEGEVAPVSDAAQDSEEGNNAMHASQGASPAPAQVQQMVPLRADSSPGAAADALPPSSPVGDAQARG
jgi:hypothetical protein